MHIYLYYFLHQLVKYRIQKTYPWLKVNLIFSNNISQIYGPLLLNYFSKQLWHLLMLLSKQSVGRLSCPLFFFHLKLVLSLLAIILFHFCFFHLFSFLMINFSNFLYQIGLLLSKILYFKYRISQLPCILH